MCFSAARIMMFDMCGTHRRLGEFGRYPRPLSVLAIDGDATIKTLEVPNSSRIKKVLYITLYWRVCANMTVAHVCSAQRPIARGVLICAKAGYAEAGNSFCITRFALFLRG